MPQLLSILVAIAVALGSAHAQEARAVLLAHCIANAGPDHPACTLTLFGQESRDLVLVKADATKATFASSSMSLSVPWRVIDDAQLLVLAEATITEAGAAQRAAFLTLLGPGYRSHPLNHQLSTSLGQDDPEAYAAVLAVRQEQRSRPTPSKARSSKPRTREPADDAAPVAAEADEGWEAIVDTAGGAEAEAVEGGEEPLAGDIEEWLATTSILDEDGEVDRRRYIREVATYTPRSIHRRFGPTYDFFNPGSDEAFPDVYQPPDQAQQGTKAYAGAPFQLGSFVGDAGGFSSTVAQVLYLATEKNDHGVDRVYVGCNAHGVYWQKPFYWRPGGSHPEPAVKSATYSEMAGGFLDKPVAQARGAGVWCNASLMVFHNGMVVAGGSNTSEDRHPTFRFPRHKIPTAITLTSLNEFALVTLWDVKALKGQVAVLALESSYPKDSGLMSIYSWSEEYPGLCNVGGFRKIKLLGYLDLPGMHAPTAISAWNNARWWGHHLSTKGSLSDQAERDKWRAGLEGKAGLPYQGGSNAGYAVVASRSEDKVLFIDLGPLFRFMAKMYFMGPENFARTRDLGPAPDQWPMTFEAAPESKPRVSAPVTVTAPTAVLCSAFGSNGSWFGHQSGIGAQAYVASMDGKLRIFSTDALADPSPAAAKTRIAVVGGIRVGRNPTCLAYDKTRYSKAENVIWVVSRGDRKIQRVSIAGTSATIDITIRDARLKDPVWARVTDNHSNAGKILMVCDFEGKRITGYRYERVKLTTGDWVGVGPTGDDPFERTGSLELTGYPFSISTSNVN